MRRRTPVLLALVAAVVVVVTAVAWPRDDGRPAPGTVAREQDPDAVEVVVLVPAGVDADPVTDLVESAARMREDRPGAGAPLVISVETLDGQDTRTLGAPEVVVVAADADGAADPAAVELHDAAGTPCRSVGDVFALTSWSGLPGFSSHHALPEGILREGCPGGSPVCVVVNATLTDPATAGNPFAAFTLVGDELAHCLDPDATDRSRS